LHILVVGQVARALLSRPEMVNALDDEDIVFTDIETAVRAVKEGGMVVVMDDEDRENEVNLKNNLFFWGCHSNM
jgi:hypothetical protein